MLKKDNRTKVLEVFFLDPIPEGGHRLRELSRKTGIAPLSVKNYLDEFSKENLVRTKRIHNSPAYYANTESDHLKFLKKVYNTQSIKESGVVEYLYETCIPDVIILFGSYSKGENIPGSDVDLYVQCRQKHLDLGIYEKKLSAKINIFFSESFGKLSKELKNNLLNGIILHGYIKIF